MDATLTRLSACERIREGVSPPLVGLWRSWERASMAWKRSSVRSRPGPPITFLESISCSALAALKLSNTLRRVFRHVRGTSATEYRLEWWSRDPSERSEPTTGPGYTHAGSYQRSA